MPKTPLDLSPVWINSLIGQLESGYDTSQRTYSKLICKPAIFFSSHFELFVAIALHVYILSF